MADNGFYNVFKHSLESMKEESVSSLLTTDNDYQNYADQENLAEKRYMDLSLSAEQRTIVNQLLDARDRQNIEYSNLSYLAGIADCIKILKYLNISFEELLKGKGDEGI
nr:hypothetical protein [uncultured Mediterraneibacter sp.]